MNILLKTLVFLSWLVLLVHTGGTRTTKAPTTKTTKTTQVTTTSKTTTSPSVSYSLYEKQALAETNYYRKVHCAPSLTFNANIKVIAQNYANYLCVNNVFAHSGNTYQGQPLGENLYGVGSSAPINIYARNGSAPVDAWYSEVNYYNYSNPVYSSSTAHFTQTVWVNSKLFGLGYCCTSNNHTCYVVANYYPAGNYDGEFASNVLRGTCG